MFRKFMAVFTFIYVVLLGMFVQDYYEAMSTPKAHAQRVTLDALTDDRKGVAVKGTDAHGFPVLRSNTTGACDGEDCRAAYARQKAEIMVLKAKMLQDKQDFDKCYETAVTLSERCG